MVHLSSRCLAFAEVVVTMVCPMLLTLSLKKDKEPVLPMSILAVAGATVVTGICPLLACCISKTERFRTVGARWPSVTRGLAATISSACLLVLACWIALRLVSKNFVMLARFLFGVCLLIRAFSYWTRSAENRGLPEIKGGGAVADEEEEKELRSMVDKSHEFLSGVTGILFLGLGGLALEGLLSTHNGAGDALRPHMTISLFVCAFGVILMFVQMIPPRASAMTAGVVYFTDVTVAVGTAALLVTIMVKLMGVMGLLFLVFPVIIFVQLMYTVKINAWRSAAQFQQQGARENGEKRPTASPPAPIPPAVAGGDSNGGDNQGEESKPAPMGLTKVTLTGFLAVSVKAISGGSPSEWTVCFLLFAAAAIASGVSWRLLSPDAHPQQEQSGRESCRRRSCQRCLLLHASLRRGRHGSVRGDGL